MIYTHLPIWVIVPWRANTTRRYFVALVVAGTRTGGPKANLFYRETEKKKINWIFHFAHAHRAFAAFKFNAFKSKEIQKMWQHKVVCGYVRTEKSASNSNPSGHAKSTNVPFSAHIEYRVQSVSCG